MRKNRKFSKILDDSHILINIFYAMKKISYSNSYYYFSEQLCISMASENRLYWHPLKFSVTFTIFAYEHSTNLGTWIDSDFATSIIFHFIWPFIKVLWAQSFILNYFNPIYCNKYIIFILFRKSHTYFQPFYQCSIFSRSLTQIVAFRWKCFSLEEHTIWLQHCNSKWLDIHLVPMDVCVWKYTKLNI